MAQSKDIKAECVDGCCMEHSGVKADIVNIWKKIKSCEDDVHEVKVMAYKLYGILAANLLGIIATLAVVLLKG